MLVERLSSWVLHVVACWGAGLGAFLVSMALTWAPRDTVMVRKLARLVRCVLAPGVAVLNLPLIYVAAFLDNPVGNQDVSVVHKDRSLLFWYPRPTVALLAHLLLGRHVATHAGLRSAYAVALGLAIASDSASLLLMMSQLQCLRAGRCDIPQGYSLRTLTSLAARDALALLGDTWISAILVYVAVADVVFDGRDRAAVLVTESRRCGFLDDDRRHRHHNHKPVNNARRLCTTTATTTKKASSTPRPSRGRWSSVKVVPVDR